jgi:hypothetical protein
MKETYMVEVNRTSTRMLMVAILAESEAEAKSKAVEEAGNRDFRDGREVGQADYYVGDQCNVAIKDKDFTYETKAAKDTPCGMKGIPHKMKRWNCYDTSCINPGCMYSI